MGISGDRDRLGVQIVRNVEGGAHTSIISSQHHDATMHSRCALHGGVPTDKIRYDNLKPAVSRELFGRTRVETQRWVAFRSTYGFDAFYCQPGHEGSHEKGGVEGEGGRFRRNRCVPMPRVESSGPRSRRRARGSVKVFVQLENGSSWTRTRCPMNRAGTLY